MDTNFLVINRIGTLRRQTVKTLIDLGYTGIRHASDAGEALEEIAALALSKLVIILELTISGLTSNEEFFLEQLNHNNLLKSVPVIVTSQRADKALIYRLSAFHIKSFIIKTGSDESFSLRMAKAIGKHKSPVLPGQINRTIQKEAAIA